MHLQYVCGLIDGIVEYFYSNFFSPSKGHYSFLAYLALSFVLCALELIYEIATAKCQTPSIPFSILANAWDNTSSIGINPKARKAMER